MLTNNNFVVSSLICISDLILREWAAGISQPVQSGSSEAGASGRQLRGFPRLHTGAQPGPEQERPEVQMVNWWLIQSEGWLIKCFFNQFSLIIGKITPHKKEHPASLNDRWCLLVWQLWLYTKYLIYINVHTIRKSSTYFSIYLFCVWVRERDVYINLQLQSSLQPTPDLIS